MDTDAKLNDDSQDSDIVFPSILSREELLERCRREQHHLKIKRTFRRVGEETGSCDQLRVMQWNVLAQALNSSFPRCPPEALEWSSRRYQMLEEIIEYCPDIICLQEVDHFNFLSGALSSQGYKGVFFPKFDSPCKYIQGNNGPDGCAIFYNSDKFNFIASESRILEVGSVQTKQVAVLVNLQVCKTGREVCITTTHLKAKNKPQFSKLRDEQGKDLLRFLAARTQGRPLIICGDFNAEPTEPVYMTMLGHSDLRLASVYAQAYDGTEPPYTTWKVRAVEICHTIDYVFYSQGHLSVDAVLEFPTGEEIGEGRIPSFNYPSDHFSLICDLRFTDPNKPS